MEKKEGKKRERGGKRDLQTDFYFHNSIIGRFKGKGGENVAFVFNSTSRYERSDKLLWVSQKLKTGFFFFFPSLSKNRVFFYGLDHTK